MARDLRKRASETGAGPAPASRGAVFVHSARQIVQLAVAIEELLVRGIDRQIACSLGAVAGPVRVDRACELIALELGTPPDTVAWHLILFERRGWLACQGGMIEIRNRTELGYYARFGPSTPSTPPEGALQ